MSRADMLAEWFSGLEQELGDFFIYYFTAGEELTHEMFFPFLLVVWIFNVYILSDGTLGGTLLDRIKESLYGSFLLAWPIGAILWLPLNFAVGFVFGPVRP